MRSQTLASPVVAGRSCTALLVASAGAMLATTPALAAAGAGFQVGPMGLPTSLVGEAATVALAFTLPALLAGAFLGAKKLFRSIGLKGALAICTLGIIAAFATIVVEQRPDLFWHAAGL